MNRRFRRRPQPGTFLLPCAFLSGMVKARAWRVAVTDRRLLVARGWFGTRPRAAALGEFESVSLDHAAYVVRIRAGGWETEIHPEAIDLQELTGALDAAKGAAP